MNFLILSKKAVLLGQPFFLLHLFNYNKNFLFNLHAILASSKVKLTIHLILMALVGTIQYTIHLFH